MSSAQWLIATIAIAIFITFGIPCIFSIWRMHDYNMQIRGKKPIRIFSGNENLYSERELTNQSV